MGNRFVPGLGLRLESEATFWGRNGFDRVVEGNPASQAWSPVYKRGRRVNCQQQHALRSRGHGRVIEVRGLREPRRQAKRLILSLSGVCDGFCTGRGRFF